MVSLTPALPPQPREAPLTCAVSHKCEQERSPGHGGDAPVLCFLSPLRTESACTALILAPSTLGGGHFMQINSPPGR